MGSEYFCPYCHALLTKSEMDQAYSKLSGFIMTSSWGDNTVRCPSCGEDIDRMEIVNCKYDRKWWQFWDKGVSKLNKPVDLPTNYSELSRAELAEIELKRMKNQK